MRASIRKTGITVLLCVSTAAWAADSPFAGTWKVDKDKSKVSGDTVRFAPAGNKVHVAFGAVAYDFTPDGSDSTTPFGTSAWKKVDRDERVEALERWQNAGC